MNTQQFMDLSAIEKVEVVNKMLKENNSDLKIVASKLDLSESNLSKTIRANSSFQYNKTSKQYERIMPIEEYKKYLQTSSNEDKSDETLQYLSDHLEEIKGLLHVHSKQLILEPEIYDPKSKTVTKSVQVNSEIYQKFSELHSSRFSHLKIRDLISKALYDFIRVYQPKETPED